MFKIKNKHITGAFADAAEYTVNEHIKEAEKVLQYLIDNNIQLSGEEMLELMFGGYQRAVDKYGPLLEKINPGT